MSESWESLARRLDYIEQKLNYGSYSEDPKSEAEAVEESRNLWKQLYGDKQTT